MRLSTPETAFATMIVILIQSTLTTPSRLGVNRPWSLLSNIFKLLNFHLRHSTYQQNRTVLTIYLHCAVFFHSAHFSDFALVKKHFWWQLRVSITNSNGTSTWRGTRQTLMHLSSVAFSTAMNDFVTLIAITRIGHVDLLWRYQTLVLDKVLSISRFVAPGFTFHISRFIASSISRFIANYLTFHSIGNLRSQTFIWPIELLHSSMSLRALRFRDDYGRRKDFFQGGQQWRNFNYQLRNWEQDIFLLKR